MYIILCNRSALNCVIFPFRAHRRKYFLLISYRSECRDHVYFLISLSNFYFLTYAFLIYFVYHFFYDLFPLSYKVYNFVFY